MIGAIINCFKIEELRRRIIFTLLVLVIVRLGVAIPVPGVNATVLNHFFKSIVDASCATSGCHSEKDKAGGILLHNYDRVKSIFVSGKGLCSIKHKCIPMPEDGPMLSASIIKKIECWVESGAPQ